jgi:signal transduction histidine kinase/DNA-binding response OmpR family regulator/ligand-binding sensor domain-containing protein
VQDSNGFIWITTDDGVDRFDGKNIVHYDLENQDELASMGFRFDRILIDKYDNIFVVNSRCYIFKLNKKSEKFELLKGFEKVYRKYVIAVFIDSNHNLILGTPNNLIVYNYVSKSLDLLKIRNTRSIIKYGDGFILGADGKLIKANSDFSKLEVLGEWTLNKGERNLFNSIFYDENKNRIWIDVGKTGIFYFDLSTNKYREAAFNNLVKDFPLWDMKLINDSTLLLGTDGSGLIELNTNTAKIAARYQYDQDNDNSLSSNVIHGILLTKDSLYFVTTDLGGVNIINPHRPDFQRIKRERGNPNSLRNNVVYSIRELSHDLLVFGTDRGLSFWNRKTGLWKHPGRYSANNNNVATGVANAKDGTFWVSYFIGKTRVFNASGKFRELPPEIASVTNSKAMLFDDRTNTLWMARNSNHTKLVSYNFDTHILNHFTIPSIHTIVKYKDNKILAGTANGLYIIDSNTSEYTLINSELKNKLKQITSLVTDAGGMVWIGSDGGGLARLNVETKSITQYNSQNGLPSNNIYTLNIDNEGNVWAGTNYGISKIEPSTGSISNYFSSDGVAHIDFMHCASCKLHTGEIIIGGSNGATLFNPETISPPDCSSHLVFTSLYVNQKKITVENSDILSDLIDKTEEIELNYDENSFSIKFVNVDLTHPKQHKYKWKLEGFDADWTKPSRFGVATYSNLAPGKYSFRVKLVSKLQSNEKIHEREIKIVIHPPSWRTPFAFVFYFLLMLLIILLALYYNKLMHDVTNTKEKLQYLANMAHEIKTPLTLIRAPIGDVIRQAESKTVKEKLELAMENIEKLQMKIGQFLDFKKIDRIEYIHPEKIDIIAFVKKKIFAFDLVAGKNSIKLTFESAVESQIIYCAPDILDRIVSNLLSNAVKYNKPGGFINVRIEVEEPYWILTITDSGIGIPRKEQSKIFRPFYRAKNAIVENKPGSGVGLALVTDMVKVLNGTISLKSKVDRGSTFTIKLPVGKPDIHNTETEQTIKDSDTELTETESTDSDLFKILIVEDNSELRDYIKKELSRYYKVIEAVDGEDGFAKVQKELPDLVLSDVAMPRMNGRQLCINIKSLSSISHIPVILLSGLDSKEHILKGLDAGADDYITKPFDSLILTTKIENLINSRKKVKEKLLKSADEGFDADIKNDLDKQFVKQITEIIEENLSDSELSVRLLYSSVGMSRTAFYHKLKSLIDLSPAEFIRTIRLNRAKELLKAGKYNVNEVAYMSGFSDPKYFSTSFKKQFGKSPSAYIK